MRAALIEPIYGVSDKVLAMALSALLLGASDVEQLFTSLRNQAVKSASWLASIFYGDKCYRFLREIEV
jgi:hypothetical protein